MQWNLVIVDIMSSETKGICDAVMIRKLLVTGKYVKVVILELMWV
jgi:hypothetical protein